MLISSGGYLSIFIIIFWNDFKYKYKKASLGYWISLKLTFEKKEPKKKQRKEE